jgi:hypothetical protein
MVDAMSKPMRGMIHQQYLKNQDKLPPDFPARMNKITDDMLKNFSWGDLIDSMIPVYQKLSTKGDIDALVAFYETPTGQKLLRVLPEITAESMQQMMPLLQKSVENTQRELQEDITAMIKESRSKTDTSTLHKKIINRSWASH